MNFTIKSFGIFSTGKKQLVMAVSLLSIPAFLYAQENKPGKRAHHQLIYDEAAKVVMMTTGSTPLDGGQSAKRYNDVWLFNGKEWKQNSNAGVERSDVKLAYDTKRNKIYALDLPGTDNNTSAELQVFENGHWKKISSFPATKIPRQGFVYDAERDKLVAFGKTEEQDPPVNSTWEWDGNEWKKIEIPGPAAGQGFAMVYDSKRKKTVLFGGMGKTFSEKIGDLWEYDGKAWTKIEAPGPGARMAPGFTYDDKRGMMIIFGGSGTHGLLNDTWGWDGIAWKKLSDAGPVKRAMGNMAYDKNRDKIVLFGGRLGWPNDANDTWEWDGSQWTEIK